MNIAIVDYGMGNLGSILNMLRYLEIEAVISSDPDEINRAAKIILPGVGAFDHGIMNLKTSGLFNLLMDKVIVDKAPILGICLGMQLMTLGSDEGNLKGFGWIKATTKRFDTENNKALRIPHTGWNRLQKIGENPIADRLDDHSKFYFVHSFYVVCEDSRDSVCKTTHGVTFDSIIARENVFGCQFHPEKSHRHGMQVLRNFDRL